MGMAAQGLWKLVNRARPAAGRVVRAGMLALALSTPLHAQPASIEAASPQRAETIYQLPQVSAIADPLHPLADRTLEFNASWSAAVALLADPVDTRLARSFDIQIATLVRSFQFSGYVLEAYALPWRAGKGPAGIKHREVPGVLLFRRDRWREQPTQQREAQVDYFALFIVGESPVFGIQRIAFCHAALQTLALNAVAAHPPWVDSRPCNQPDLPLPAPATSARWRDGSDPHAVPVLGPMFSGSLTSLADMAGRGKFRLRLLSPSATVSTNPRVRTLQANVTFESFASWQQDEQLAILFWYLLRNQGICPSQVVILAEESSFGQGAVELSLPEAVRRSPEYRKTCHGNHEPRRVQFSQNVAAIRAEHALRDAKRQGKVSLSMAPKRFLELDMKDVANSPDLPPVYQPSLTSRSDELALQQLMDALAVHVRPKAVIVVATDVRDRLFMLGQVRRALPAALPIVLEGDHLLAHPDYRGANRGTLMVRNTPMTLCYSRSPRLPAWRDKCGRSNEETRYFAFPTDYAAALFRASRDLLVPRGEVMGPRGMRGSPMVVITLAGTQSVEADAPISAHEQLSERQQHYLSERMRRGSDTLIAGDLRLLVFRFLVPLGVLACGLLLICSAWLWRSSRPGRAMLPLLRHATREGAWWVAQRFRDKQTPPEHEPRDRATHMARHDRSSPAATRALTVLAALLFLYMAFIWAQLLGFISPFNHLYDTHILRLVHGRDLGMTLALAAFYAWGAGLAVMRIHAWNQRCHRHWNLGKSNPERRDPHAQRDYHGTALAYALPPALFLLLTWCVRNAQAVDATAVPTLLSFLVLTASFYFLMQASLQTYRLFSLARDVRDEVLERQPVEVVPPEWPTPRQLGIAPQSPITVAFRDRDWQALESKNPDWPMPPPQHPVSADAKGYWRKEITGWRDQTVAEMRFGLSCVRSCLSAAFAGPLVLLAMIQVYPFAFEWEHSAAALSALGLAFAASAYFTYRAEQAPLIGQMFTKDGAHVSIVDMLGALSGKLLLLLFILAATLAPNLSQQLQSLLSALQL